jgi:isochorismate synthase
MSQSPSTFLALKKPNARPNYYQESKVGHHEFRFVDFKQQNPISIRVESVDFLAQSQWIYREAPHTSNREAYRKSLEDLHGFLNQSSDKKVVFSRAQIFKLAQDPHDLFLKLCDAYPAATVYLFSHPKCGTWLGASPETLISFKGDEILTASLAGTLPYDSKLDFGKKEELEQRIVTDYIVNTLNRIPSVNKLIKGPTTSIRAGNLKHLHTPIKANLDDPLSLDAVLDKLHPTPAVAGNPKMEALSMITELEGYDRSYYTGYFGLMTGEEGDFWVNLRCAQITSADKICLYAGGGIIAASDARAEWEETESKMQTILNVML